jgi:hypothetical protein
MSYRRGLDRERGWGDGGAREINQGRSQVLIYSSARPPSASADDVRVRACMMLGLDLSRSTSVPACSGDSGGRFDALSHSALPRPPPTPPTKGPRDEKRETKAQLPGLDAGWGARLSIGVQQLASLLGPRTSKSTGRLSAFCRSPRRGPRTRLGIGRAHWPQQPPAQSF